jgi:UDP-N-acetylglucosamine 3-dehydrogenase
MGKNHLRLLKEIPSFNLIGVVEPNSQIAAQNIDSETKVFNSLEDVDAEYSAVVIATPIPTHFDLSMKLLKMGKDLLIEKPLSPTKEECDQILEYAKEQKRIVAVGHSERHNPAFVTFCEELEKIDLGKIFRYEFHRIGPYPFCPGDFGVVKDLAVHDFDLYFKLTKTIPKWIFSQKTSQFHPTHEDGLTLMSGYNNDDNEVLSLFNINWLSPRKQRFVRAYGEHGMLEVNLFERKVHFYESKLRRNRPDDFGIHGIEYGETKEIEVPEAEPLRNELEHFANRIINDLLDNSEEYGSRFAVALADEVVKVNGHKILEQL